MKKLCPNCRVEKEIDNFHKVRKTDPLRKTYCIPCDTALAKDWLKGGLPYEEYNRRHTRARNRAVSRLSRMFPDVYANLLADEKRKVEIDPSSVERRRRLREHGAQGA